MEMQVGQTVYISNDNSFRDLGTPSQAVVTEIGTEFIYMKGDGRESSTPFCKIKMTSMHDSSKFFTSLKDYNNAKQHYKTCLKIRKLLDYRNEALDKLSLEDVTNILQIIEEGVKKC